MPIIPSEAGSQVLNASSPVPIASSADERAWGEAVSNIGEGLMHVSKRINDNRDSLVAGIAADQYKKQLLKEYANQQTMAPIEGDTSGFGASEAIISRADESTSFINDNLENDRQRLMFKNQIGDFQNSIAAQAFASEIKKRADINELLTTKSMMAKADILTADPSQTSTILADIEASILENPDIPPAKKPTAVVKYQQMALSRATNSLTNNGNYEAAKILVEQFAPKLYDEEDKQKLIQQIDTADYQNSTRELARSNAEAVLVGKQKEEARQISYQKAMEMRARAGNDMTSNAIVDEWIMSQPALTGNDKKNLISTRGVFPKAQDDAFESQIITRAIKGENINTLVKEVDKQAGFSYDMDRAGSLKKWLFSTQDKFEKDPNYRIAVQGGLNIIKAQIDDNLGELEKVFSPRDIKIKAGQAQVIFGKALQTNPNGNIEAMAFSAVKQVFGNVRALKPTRGKLPSQDTNTLPGIKKRMDALNKEYIGGSLTQPRKDQIKSEMKELLKKQEMIEKEKGINSGAQNTGTTKPGFVPATR